MSARVSHPVFDGDGGQNAARAGAVEYAALPNAARCATYVCAHGESPDSALVSIYLTAHSLGYRAEIRASRDRVRIGVNGYVFTECRRAA